MVTEQILERQVADWEAEINRLAGLVTAARNGGVAFVRIAACDEYDGVTPQLVVEDALGVATRGWPDGFDVDVLGTS